MKQTLLLRIILINIFITFSFISSAQSNSIDSVVRNFINLIKQNNVEKIAAKVTYPFCREYPIPCINSKSEFIKRYHEIFDDSLKNMIINSNVDSDWSEMGWRGIMFLDGSVWLDEDGNLTGVNYQSKFENKEWNKLVEIEKAKLYSGIRDFKSPILYWETKTLKIRIDETDEYVYRYVAWSKNKNQSDTPDLIINNGEVDFQGSGGNHTFTFKKDEYTYICDVQELGDEETPPDILTVLKNGKEIMKQIPLKVHGE